MAFLRPQIYKEKDRFLIADNLEDAVFCRWNGISIPVGTYDVDDLDDSEDSDDVLSVAKQFDCAEFEIVETFYGVLEPAGCYLDRSSYVLGDTVPEVAQQLLDLYFDGDPEYMDEGEKEDLAWLESVVKGEVK